VIFGGTGVLAYFVAMIIIPKTPIASSENVEQEIIQASEPFSNRFWGVLLFVAGLLLLVGLIGPIGGLFAGLTVVMGSVLWPLIVILLGLYLFFNTSTKKNTGSPIDEVFPDGKKLYRSSKDSRVAGVCGGIGEYFGIDSNIIRIFWVMATIGSFGFGLLAYFMLAIFLPENN
jgi:phage shock protein C